MSKKHKQKHQLHKKHTRPQDHKAKGGHNRNNRHEQTKAAQGGARRPVTPEDLPRVCIGTFQRRETFGFVLPDDRKYPYDIFIPIEDSMGALDGEKVTFEITRPATNRHKPEGIITECLGFVDDAIGNDVLYIAKAHDLPMEWPEKVQLQTTRVAKEVSQADIDFRRDLRDLDMVTIDGDDAKDLDDAVSLTIDPANGDYILGVHIADVSNYVQEGSALDKEALHRGTSVYLVDRVIPMLPVELSNGVCSLNAGENRLALSCIMHITPGGEVISHEICESVICVNERMSYSVVDSIINRKDDSAEYLERYKALVPMFDKMFSLSKILRERRAARGAIDFDFPEAKVVLDEMGRPADIHIHEANDATRLIEDFMLAANETVAEHFAELGIPFLYRVHEDPSEEKLQLLRSLLERYGYFLKEDNIRPRDIQQLLHNIEGTDEAALLERQVLRSMSQARYAAANLGHFGLAATYYCHFTSPIRRYPDLQIHRIIREVLHGRMDDRRRDHYTRLLPQVGERTSELERRAERAERDSVKMKMAEYMSHHIGEIYEGIISGVTEWGIYVELPNGVEGMIFVRTLGDDYYVYDETAAEMRGRATGRTFRMGDRITIEVVSADKVERLIDFELVEPESL